MLERICRVGAFTTVGVAVGAAVAFAQIAIDPAQLSTAAQAEYRAD